MRVNVFIRKEDESAWRALKNKSEWVHEQLNVNKLKAPNDSPRFIAKPPDPELGYPCCQTRRPCKHWTFDGSLGLWINSITGKSKEVV